MTAPDLQIQMTLGCDIQNDDFIPEQFRAPDALPRLLGLAGESIHCHLHVGVDSGLAVVHLGLC